MLMGWLEKRSGHNVLTRVASIAIVLPMTAYAAPCVGVRHLPGTGSPALLAILSAQTGHPVGLDGFYRQNAWTIYEVSLNGDPGYMFFNGPPRRSPKAFVWGGSAQPNEYADVLAVVQKNAPGIPISLARCFVRHVTGASK
jgi:hypothetical protein